MSKLQSKLAKAGIELPAEKPKGKQSKLETLSAPKEIKTAVDAYLDATDAENEAKAQRAIAASTLSGFFLDHVFKKKDPDNAMVEGDKGAVNLIIKSQYGLKDPEALKAVMKANKLDYEEFVIERTAVVIDFDKLTDAEITKVVNLIKGFGQERAADIVSEKTTYKISEGFLKEMIRVDNKEAFDSLREASGHYTPTVAPRKKG